MPTCGIVAEYNPFHTGHQYHIAETRRRLLVRATETDAASAAIPTGGAIPAGADCRIVCVMSGNYVQRGDLALFDKYDRAAMAVRHGADLVVELPLAAALSSAEGFAQGAVMLLHALGCDTLSFGAETADLSLLCRAAAALDSLDSSDLSNPPAASVAVATCSLSAASNKLPQSSLSRRKATDSYAAWRQAALRQLDPETAALLDAPNNTLGIAYCRAARRHGMQLLAIPRVGAAYHADAPTDGFASARFLREQIRQGNPRAALPYLPDAAQVQTWLADGKAVLAFPDAAVLAVLRRLLYEGRLCTRAVDGFDQRLQQAVSRAGSYEEAVEMARTRRFPAARVRRAFLRLALDVAPNASVFPHYARILAIGAQGRALLRNVRSAGLPLLTKPVAEKRLPGELQPLLARDAFADDFFALALTNPARRQGGFHYRHTPFVVTGRTETPAPR